MKEILSANLIKKHLSSAYDVEVFDALASTNTLAKDIAKRGRTNFIIAAREQTSGRGRFERKFYSPKDCGIYFSVAVTPKNEEEVSFVTPLCAVACAKAIRELSGKDARIKWVNDIYIDDKKCVGILCEGVSTTSSAIDRVIVGVGVNLVEGDHVEDEIRDIIGYVGDVSPNELLAKIVDNIEVLRADFNKDYIARQYKDLSLLIGRDVVVSKAEMSDGVLATVLDIDNECRLAVRYADDRRENLAIGEVRLRLK